jgi:hypothetical protein
MVNALTPLLILNTAGFCAGFMMNKSLRLRGEESSRIRIYGFWPHGGDDKPDKAKKEPPFPAALKLITGRRQTEWTGATRCPNEDNAVINEKA